MKKLSVHCRSGLDNNMDPASTHHEDADTKENTNYYHRRKIFVYMIFFLQLSGLRAELRAEVSAHQGFREYQPGLLNP